MDHLTWGYLQLGLVALAFGALQIWWIGSILRKPEPTSLLNGREFRKTLERIWTKKS